MTTTGENARTHGKRAGLTLVVLATLAGLPLFPASLVIAGFTLWGIGEQNYPPPFLVDPMEWVWNFFSLFMPVATIIVVAGAWVSYWRQKYSRIGKYVMLGVACGLLWLPGMATVMGIF